MWRKWTDLYRGLVVPLALCVFAAIALARAARGGITALPLVLLLLMVVLAVLRLRDYARSRRARGRTGGRAEDRAALDTLGRKTHDAR